MNIGEIELQLSGLVKQPFDNHAFRLLEIYNEPKAMLVKVRKGSERQFAQLSMRSMASRHKEP